jgi:hypothetical protein
MPTHKQVHLFEAKSADTRIFAPLYRRLLAPFQLIELHSIPASQGCSAVLARVTLASPGTAPGVFTNENVRRLAPILATWRL